MHALRLAAFPAVLLVAAGLLAARQVPLPAAADAALVWIPYAACLAGGALALAFNRGRALFALLTLAAAYAACVTLLPTGPGNSAARSGYVGLAAFIPLNLALLSATHERGLWNRHGALRLGVLAAECAVTAWFVTSPNPAFVTWAWQPWLDPAWFSTTPLTPLPQSALAALAAGLLITLALAVVRRLPIECGFAGALVAGALALHAIGTPRSTALWFAAAAVCVTVAVLQDSFRMAFRDELTALPSRRALNEALAGLGSRYAIAMLDVDHFKKFNDTHGHDVGDQVLRMVAAQIGRIGGGGRAFRYGGEEFTVLFSGRDTDEVLPALEAVRAAIEGYRMQLRAPDRPVAAKKGRSKRAGGPVKSGGSKTVAVTISIGVAERGPRSPSPEAVIKAADKALYRAKHKGRNQVSR
jgi:diguanylate cyclase (GGDEF)-like protein